MQTIHEENQISLQTSLFAKNSCVFTGHRLVEEGFNKKALKKAVEMLINKGITVFYNGMACGFDLIAGETVLDLKKKYKQIRFIACIPCVYQDKAFPSEEKKRYAKILKKADEKIMVSNEPYFVGCMHKRNRFMCDKADVMVAYCKKEKGGTAYTVKYFQKTYPNKQVIFL